MTQQHEDDRAIQILSNEGAQCGSCGDEPGDRNCPDCEKFRAGYVAALRAAGWAPQEERDAMAAEIRRLRAELARRVQCNDCGAVGEIFTADDGRAYLDPSGQIWHQPAARP